MKNMLLCLSPSIYSHLIIDGTWMWIFNVACKIIFNSSDGQLWDGREIHVSSHMYSFLFLFFLTLCTILLKEDLNVLFFTFEEVKIFDMNVFSKKIIWLKKIKRSLIKTHAIDGRSDHTLDWIRNYECVLYYFNRWSYYNFF